MAVVQRRGHQFRRLAAGVAEHDALVAGADILVAGFIDALGDVDGLRMQQHVDLGGLPMEAILLVADRLDGLAGSRLHLRLDLLVVRLVRTSPAITTRLVVASVSAAMRTCRPACRPWRLPCRTGRRSRRKSVADLVGVAFRHRFAGEVVTLARHEKPSLQWVETDVPLAFDGHGTGQACGRRNVLRQDRVRQNRLRIRLTERADRKSNGFCRVFRKSLDQIDHAAANGRVLDPHEGPGKLQALAGGDELCDVARLAIVGEAGGRRSVRHRRAVEEEGHVDAQDARQLLEPAGADPVGSLLVLLDLLEGDASCSPSRS